MIEVSQKSREGNLFALFDDPYELQPSAFTINNESSSGGTTTSASEENEETLNSTDTLPDTNIRNGKKPRRAKTYHGAADSRSKKL